VRPGPGAGVDPDGSQDLLLQLGSAGDGGDGLVAGGEGDLPDAVELLEGPVSRQVLLVEIGSRRSASVSRLPMSCSTTAASTQIAMCPRTRFSVKCRIGRSPREDLSTRNRRSTACRDR
jgi:hypothetical protein